LRSREGRVPPGLAGGGQPPVVKPAVNRSPKRWPTMFSSTSIAEKGARFFPHFRLEPTPPSHAWALRLKRETTEWARRILDKNLLLTNFHSFTCQRASHASDRPRGAFSSHDFPPNAGEWVERIGQLTQIRQTSAGDWPPLVLRRWFDTSNP